MKPFHLLMIKPSHYDDDGYVIQWWRSAMPSNSLAALYALAQDCDKRKVLGDDVEIRMTALDESNTRIKPRALARMIKRDGGQGLVALVGVQSNQFPRAEDLAKTFRSYGLPVCIGGFHVSGCLAMLEGVTPELQEMLDLGVSLYAGEVEGRLDQVLCDARDGTLQPIYNHMDDLPSIEYTPPPFLTKDRVMRTGGKQTSFDAGRGCPFLCSFCTIINVQGRKSRYRNADDVEQIIRENLAQGINRFFVTDDNFARNRNWEPIFDRLIELREREGLSYNLFLQVDTMCHKIAGFIEKSRAAGVSRVFIGLENVDPENLQSARKKQNKIGEFRATFLAWKRVKIATVAGYITGFPNDTPESIARSIELIKRELPVDLVEFFFLTPLPGSQDHKELHEKGIYMDGDLNKYDLNHIVTHHEKMSRDQWMEAYHQCWCSYYSDEHMMTLMKRAYASDISPKKIMETALWFNASIFLEGVHPLEAGLLRRKYRKDRRPSLEFENPLLFYPRYAYEFVSKHWSILRMLRKYRRMLEEVKSDPRNKEYTDIAMTPMTETEAAEMELRVAQD